MNIELFYEDIAPLKLQKSTVKKYINQLILSELRILGELSIVLCSDEYLLNMNKQYLNHDYYTDIITFNYVENETISGDLFLSYDRIKDNAQIFETDIEKELFRVIFHGVLHLIGYEDHSEDEKLEI